MTVSGKYVRTFIDATHALPDGMHKTLWREVDEALFPTNARPSDGNNYKKLIEIKTCVAGGDKGEPVFVLAVKSPRSSVNNLGLSISWSTYSRAGKRGIRDRV
jgi:hypothetical protein